MDTPVVNIKNFVEPTEKYCTELKKYNLSLSNSFETLKLWFNGDLLQWTYYYKRVEEKDKNDLNIAYKEFCDLYNVTITSKELVEKFGDYSNEDFDALIKYLLEFNTNSDLNETSKQ
ncbi:MAG: hypothetical protein WC428_02730 [Candidatus Paceibacterota bacterium]